MAKTEIVQQELDLEKVAAKFVVIPKGVTSKAQIIDGNYLTEEEYEAMKQVPRSVEMKSGTKWAKIKSGNNERSIYPFYGMLNEPEKAIYREYKKGHNAESTSSSTTTSAKVEENNKALDALKAELAVLNVPEETIAKLEQFRITKKSNLLHEMFGIDTPFALTGKVNLAYVMYRGANGEFAENLQPNIVELVQKGFMPKFTLDQVKANIEKLASKGIYVKNCIIDLK